VGGGLTVTALETIQTISLTTSMQLR